MSSWAAAPQQAEIVNLPVPLIQLRSTYDLSGLIPVNLFPTPLLLFPAAAAACALLFGRLPKIQMKAS